MEKSMKNLEKNPTIMVNPQKIEFNPENVRNEREEQIESDEDFIRLKESVYTYGVLVPLVVKKQSQGTKEFILIDGERRLRAALATNQQFVPVHIASSEIAKDEILLSFQIHMLRKEWSKTAQARALLKIIKDTEHDTKTRNEKEIFELVQEKTGYSETRMRDLFRVLRYARNNEKILDEIENANSNLKFSHLVQLEASFIEQIDRVFPDIIKEYGKNTIREKLLKKVRANVIGSTREPIDNLLPLFIFAKTETQKDYLKKLIKDFIDDERKTPNDIFRIYELRFPANKEDLLKFVEDANKKIEELGSIMNNIKFTQFNIYEKYKIQLIKNIEWLIKVLTDTRKKIK